MENMTKLYFEHDFTEFEDYLLEYPVCQLEYKAGEIISRQGETLSHGYYIKSGIMHLKIGSEIGKEKTLAFFGPGAMFPLGVNKHTYPLEYAMTETAFTDVVVYRFSYEMLRKMAENNSALSLRIIEHYCDFTSYLFYEIASRAYNLSMVLVVNVLLVFHSSIEENGIIPFNQEQVAEIAGISRIQVARAYKELKEMGVIETVRNGIKIIDEEKLNELGINDVI